ncbi:hypothetical protein GJA_4070 [Janthinobacterium agaricidamnosum NBRC 102515 = DSM 9628]|uniref:Uncharacterized protein n=1 Tax=Janthinobacterium agaricidamnosum NBRC 102515 = DSM 9628 TaxID=1349767 RepID=W0VAP6_9BURK|nr:hypothetical protein GJA_4070 [Janthinobacterium agaricidamnosum NBRC 102515 = DSM 9628]
MIEYAVDPGYREEDKIALRYQLALPCGRSPGKKILGF